MSYIMLDASEAPNAAYFSKITQLWPGENGGQVPFFQKIVCITTLFEKKRYLSPIFTRSKNKNHAALSEAPALPGPGRSAWGVK